MTTTTTATTNTATTTSTTNTKPRRPKVLIAAAVLMLLAAVLSLAAPFLPRGGFGGGMGPGGAPPANGQAAGDQGQPPANGQAPAGGRGQPPANGQGFGPGGPGGMLGFGGAQSSGTFSVMNLMQPLRIGEALVGALLALLAALGLWRLRIWGRNLALVVAAACLLSVIATLLSPLLGRTPWLMMLTGSTWQAIVGFGLALAASILALLPTARHAYVVKPKERRVI
jgi:hypothetical protein